MKKDLFGPSQQSKVQRAAVEAGVEVLKEHRRTRIAMACGVGKTFTQLKLSEQLIQAQAQQSGPGPKRVLVLVPTLELVRQNEKEWKEQNDLGDRYDRICVCSDPELKEGVLQDSDEDSIVLSDEELLALGINPVTNAKKDMARINAWLDAREAANPNAVSVIFSTYQSAKVVGDALKLRSPGDQSIDVGVFDEAHKTAGAKGKKFSYALSDANIQIDKRTFFTATERVVNTEAGRNADGDWSVTSMDDEAMYGPRAFNISFREAAEKEIIVPYKIIISVINDDNISESDIQNKVVAESTNLAVDARLIANMAALERAMESHGLKKAITFHKRVKDAEQFADIRHSIDGAQLNGFTRVHVSGAQSSEERRRAMDAFAEPGVPSVASNAKCLTEGVNVPAADIVAFMDPKSSKVDIVQAVGRVLRNAPGKEAGYILLPLHVSMRPGDSPQQAMERATADFRQIRDVLNALSESDETLKDLIRKVSMGQGSFADLGIEIQPGRGQGDKTPFQQNGLSVLDAQALVSAIETRVVQNIQDPWYVMLGELIKYKAENNGSCDVREDYTTPDGKNLGAWCSRQRTAFNKEKLFAERQKALEDLGFDWDPIESQWNDMFEALKKFKAENDGSCDVRTDYITPDGKNLGNWCLKQRTAFNKEELFAERQKALEDLGFRFDLREAKWNEMFEALKQYKADNNGSCDVRTDYTTPDGKNLRNWCLNQRKAFNKEELFAERQKALEDLGFRFDLFESQWNEMFEALKDFKTENDGSCDVPKGQKTKGGQDLSRWCITQRVCFKKEELSAERKKALEDLGFDWDPIESQWNEMFEALKKFKAENDGSCDVRKDYITPDGKTLGSWCSTQRKAFNKEKLSAERQKALEDLGFRFDLLESQWESQWNEMFEALKEYKTDNNGSCDVRRDYITPDGKTLGSWCLKQRTAFNKEELFAERQKALEDLGFRFDLREAKWNEMFEALKQYKADNNGSCDVRTDYTTPDGKNLGAWCRTQRTAFNKEELSAERQKALKDLGFLLEKITNISVSKELHPDTENSLTQIDAKPLSFNFSAAEQSELKSVSVEKDLGSQVETLAPKITIHHVAKEIAKLNTARAKIDKVSQEKSAKEMDELYRAAGQSRPLQKAFRDALTYACDGVCVATDSKAALEAAHLHQPGENKADWRINNTKGMLLTASVHRLYDAGQIEIDRDTGLISVVGIDLNDAMVNPNGKSIHGKRIAIVDLEDKKTWPVLNSMPPCPAEFEEDEVVESERQAYPSY